MSEERRGLSLATRIFLGTALILVLALGAAVTVVSILGERVAGRAARERIAASSSLVAGAEQQRLRQLRLLTEVLAGNPEFKSYLAEAIPNRDRLSILDQLDERRGDLGYDLAVVTDQNGTVAARTDQRDAEGGSLADRALLRRVRSEGEAAGTWSEGGRLYDAVAAPMATEGIFGYLLLGYRITDVRALEVKRSTGSEVLFVTGDRAVATSLTPQETERALTALRRGGDLMARAAQRGESSVQAEIELGGERWLALLSPLPDAEGKPVGAVVSLASLDRELAGYRSIRNLLAGVGVAALGAALGIAFLLSRRVSSPIRALARAVESARGGEYDVTLPRGGSGEVLALANAFNALLAELRERREMAEYVTKLSRNLPDGGAGPAAAGTGGRAEGRKITAAVLELRRYLAPRNLADPSESLARLARDLRKIAAVAANHGGRIEAVAGHRVLLGFAGDGRSERALAAAAEAAGAVAVRENAFDDAEAPAIAVVTGEALSGPVAWGGGADRVLVAPLVVQAEGLLREAESGEILLAAAVHGEAAAALTRAGLTLEAQRGLLSNQALYRLDKQGASRLSSGGLGAAGAAPGAGAPALSAIGPGTLLGSRFEILSTLGSGGMGVVYKARDRELDDLVALKMIRREVAGDRSLVERLKSELKLARKITHPNVLRTFDFGEIDAVPFISMEYVRGITLRAMLEQSGRVPYAAGLNLARQLLAGLAAAHALEILHRDIKPENVLLDPLGNLKLMDFGLARPVQRLEGGQTQPGWLVGTPHYLAPEQIEGRQPDPRCDVYACGVVLFEVFTGRLPFGGDQPMEILMRHLKEPPPAPSLYWTAIPKPLEALILRCLEKRPEARPADARALLREVERLGA